MKKPNIIHITSHDLGKHLNCHGRATVHSPHLDQLAAGGILFEKMFCAAPQCSPSRASVFTGRYPHSNGTMGLTQGTFGWDLHPGEKHLAAALKQAGYFTVLGNYQHECRRNIAGMGFDVQEKMFGYATDVTAKVDAWLDGTRPDQPFYLQLSLNEPHRSNPCGYFGHPHDSSKGVEIPGFLLPEPSARDEFALFQGSIRAMDDGIGQLIDSLKKRSLFDSTWIIFMADHGMPFPRAKCTLYDPGVEISCIMSWPEGIQGGRICQDLLSNVDLYPTILEMIGDPHVQPANLQGQSFAAFLRNKPSRTRTELFTEMTYHEYADPMRAIRTDRHKLIVNFTSAPAFMDSSQMWRPACTPVVPENPAITYHDPVELYDLATDPLEHHNLVKSCMHVGTKNDLLARLYRWMQETSDPLLEGIPAPPMYRMAMHALKTGEVVQHIEQVP